MSTSGSYAKTRMAREYWDTCLFLAYLRNRPEEQVTVDVIDSLLRRALAPASDVTIVVSTMVVAELPRRESDDPAQWRAIGDLFLANHPNVLVVAGSLPIGLRASEIGTEHPGITPSDAMHIATALVARVDVFLTLDGVRRRGRARRKDLLQYDGLIGHPRLDIRPPEMPPGSQMPLRPVTP